MGRRQTCDKLVHFEVIFRKYYPSLLAFVERHVGDREVAKDFVQDVFFKLYEGKADFQSEALLKSWLYTASRNAALDYIRHLKVVDQNQMLMAESMMYAADVDEVLNEEAVRKINAAIDSLPVQCRQIVRMNILDGLKYAQIAAQLGISVNTVKTQISRGYKKLREELAEYNRLILFYWLQGKVFFESAKF